MKASQIEIPMVEERGKGYRFFEILPGALSWSILILPFLISLISVPAAAISWLATC